MQKSIVNSRLYTNNNGTNLRSQYYILPALDENTNHNNTIMIDLPLHELRQQRPLYFEKNTRNFTKYYFTQPQIDSILRLCMFEYLGFYIPNWVQHVQNARKMVEMRIYDTNDGSLQNIYGEGFVPDAPWIVHFNVKYASVKHRRNYENIDILDFCEYLKKHLTNGSDTAISSLSYPISKIEKTTNSVMWLCRYLKKNIGDAGVDLCIHNYLVPTLYDYELALSTLQWSETDYQVHCKQLTRR